MKKSKILNITMLTILAMPAIASAETFNGGYVGIQGGYESTKADVTDTGQGAFAGINFKDQISLTGANGGLFAGYGKKFDNLYLGGEIEGSLSGADSKTSLTTGAGTITMNLEHKYDYGASIRAGMFPTKDTLIYGKVGFVRGEFKDTSVNFTKTVNGLRFGIGSETAIAPNLSVRADWSYTDYSKASYTDATQVGTANPSSNLFRVGVAYSF